MFETHRVPFQTLITDISASRWFYYKNVPRCMVLRMSNSLPDCYLFFVVVVLVVLGKDILSLKRTADRSRLLSHYIW